MQNAPLLNATIEIVEMSDKRGKFGLIKKIKGKDIESGQTNTYTVYDKKKDGSISAAWSQLQTITIGDTVSVGYTEQQGQMDDGTPFTSRIVRNFNKDIGNGVRQYQSSQQLKSPRSEAPMRSQGKPEDDYWDKKAYKQCLWRYWLERNSHLAGTTGFIGVTQIEADAVWKVFKQIEADAEKRFAKGWAKAAAIYGEELPTIN